MLDIQREISKVYPDLRRANGTPYQSDVIKATKGALHANKFFICDSSTDKWTLDIERAGSYYEEEIDKIKNLQKKAYYKITVDLDKY